MPEYDVSQGAGKVPCDTNEGLELGGGNVDRFDEMATNAVACAACKLGIRHKAEMCVVQRVAAALRETDAKAREEGRREGVFEERYRVAMIANAAARSVRDGTGECLCHETTVGKTCPLHDVESMARAADACGTTVPKEPDCWECWDSGEFPPHFHSPEDDCPNFIPSDVPGTDDLGSCGCDLVRCACQGGDDA